MDNKLYDILDDIANEFVNQNIVKEYKELDKIIYEKYPHELLMFNTAKEKLEEMKRYTTKLDIYKRDLSMAKEKLYSLPEVKRYLFIQREIQKELDKLSNEISKRLSNKFKEKKVL
ncbi:MAG: hypothetical protein K6G28_03545 [Acholeplasmatales bacterium]|nr:hypothetical protein [Acholeplasmatales bacterium]